MTEEDAKAKWCPFARTRGFATEAAVNRPFPGNTGDIVRDECTCIASACMAWRSPGESMGPQRVHPNVLDKAWTGWTVTDDVPDARGYVEISPPPRSREGFCGLAGSPQ